MQPGSCHVPFPFHGFRRNGQNLRDLGCGKASKVPQFYDLALPWIKPSQTIESFIERHHHAGLLRRYKQRLLQGNPQISTSPLLGLVGAREIHEYVAHRLSRDCEEVSSILPVDSTVAHQADKRFVNERRGLQSVIGPLSPEITRGEPVQLLVNQ